MAGGGTVVVFCAGDAGRMSAQEEAGRGPGTSRSCPGRVWGITTVPLGHHPWPVQYFGATKQKTTDSHPIPSLPRPQLHGAKGLSVPWARLAATAAKGATTLQLDSAVASAGWAVGDELMIASTDFDPYQTERARIVSVSGSQVQVTPPLRFMHYGQVTEGVDERAEVRQQAQLEREGSGELAAEARVQGALAGASSGWISNSSTWLACHLPAGSSPAAYPQLAPALLLACQLASFLLLALSLLPGWEAGIVLRYPSLPHCYHPYCTAGPSCLLHPPHAHPHQMLTP